MRYSRNNRRSRARRATCVATAVALVGLYGCASSGDDDASTAMLPSLADAVTPDSDGPAASSVADPAESIDAETAGDVDPELVMAEHEKCLADHGVAVASSGGAFTSPIDAEEATPQDSGLPPQEMAFDAFEEAMLACEGILEGAFGSFEMSPEQEAEMADMQLAFEKCLMEHGIEVETDGSGAAVITAESPLGGDPEKFEQALRECEPDPIEIGGN